MDNSVAQAVSAPLQNPVNSVQQGYQQVNSQIMAAQNLHDNNMLKVFEFAGNGEPDAAKAFAAAKGINVPPEVLQNADMTQGLFIAGKMYSNDPNAAQKFSTAWMANQGMPLQQRVLTSSTQAGAPIDPENRKYQAMAAMLTSVAGWKKANLPNAGLPHPGVSRDMARFNAGQKSYEEALKNPLAAPGAADQARQNTLNSFDANVPKASPGLVYGTEDNQVAPSDGYGGGLSVLQQDQTPDGVAINQLNQDQGGGGYAPAPATQPSPSSSPPQIAPATAPAANSGPALPAGVPAGSILMGTSGGKNVYQDQGGNKYIDHGTP